MSNLHTCFICKREKEYDDMLAVFAPNRKHAVMCCAIHPGIKKEHKKYLAELEEASTQLLGEGDEQSN